MPRAGSRLRVTALLLAAALGLHELRYLLAFGAHADTALAQQGHAYLGWVAPLVAAVVVLAGASLVHALARRRPAPAGRRGLRWTWLAYAAILLVTFTAQESLEGLLAHGHPGGVAAVLGNGGWIAVPLAAVLGGLVALALRTADEAVCAAPLLGAPRATVAPLPVLLAPAAVARMRLPVLAAGGAGRAPPHLVVSPHP